MEYVFPSTVLKEELQAISRLREDHWLAGLLAGTADPRLARRAYQGLTRLRYSQRWSLEQFSQALQGCSEDDFANTVVIDARPHRSPFLLEAALESRRLTWPLLHAQTNGCQRSLPA